MTTKRATVRLFVAITGLLASILELAGTIVHLGTAGLRLGTAVLERLTRRIHGPVAAPVSAAYAMALAPTVIAPAAPQRVTTPTLAMTGDERLTSALLSLEFPAAKVRAFAATVAGRGDTLEVLVKEGIVALSSPGPTHQVLS